MKIIKQTYEENLSRADVLGDAVAFVDWHSNAVTFNLSEETVFDETERKIREILKLENVELFRNGS